MKSRLFNIWLIAAAALYGLIFALTPWGFDDFSYTPIVFALTIALPWLDFAFTVIFALNYVWTGALT